MSEYSSLKAIINANVKTNGNQEITGSIMNSVLNAMVNSLGAGYQFMGVATPTNPATAQTPDYKCFYLATTPGTYTNLGSLVVADGEVAILKYDYSWTKEVTGAATADQVSQLGQDLATQLQKYGLLATKYSIQAQSWYGDDYTHIVIPVNGGEKVDYILTTGAFYCAFLTDYTTPIQNESPSFLEGYIGRQTYSGPSGNLTIPVGTKYFVINNPVSQGLSSVKINGLEVINGVFPAIFTLSNELQTLKGSAIVEDDLDVVITSKNLANPSNVENGLINSEGAHVPLVGDPWNMLKVPVTSGQTLTFGGFHLGRTAYYAFYNNNTLVSFALFNDPNGTQNPVTVTVPEGANILYIDISTNVSPANPFQFMQVNIGEQLVEYDEFSEKIESIKGFQVIGDGGSQGEIVDLIADLPVSDGTNIPVGYAYIDSASSVVKVKTA